MRRSLSSMTMSGTSSRKGVTFERGEGGLALALGVERATCAPAGARRARRAAARRRGGPSRGRPPRRCRPRSRAARRRARRRSPDARPSAGTCAAACSAQSCGVGAALARLDLAQRVAVVVLAGEQGAQLELAEVGPQRRRGAAIELGLDRVVVLVATQLEQASRASSMRDASVVVALEVVDDRRELAGDLAGLRRGRPRGRAATPRSRAGAAGRGARRPSGSRPPRRGACGARRCRR